MRYIDVYCACDVQTERLGAFLEARGARFQPDSVAPSYWFAPEHDEGSMLSHSQPQVSV
jgi:hypothetical protein